LSVGYSLRAPELLFRKIEDAEVKEQIGKLQAASAARVADEVVKEPGAEGDKVTGPGAPTTAGKEEAAVKPAIGYDDFAKLDLRVGTIITAEKVEKADKLLKLGIDLGSEQRTIVSGIALHFTPEEIVGRQVVVVANLSPRKMRGIESNGMILMAEDPSGKLYFVQPGEKIKPGSGVS
jgi:methionyl-tRNA synthetase